MKDEAKIKAIEARGIEVKQVGHAWLLTCGQRSMKFADLRSVHADDVTYLARQPQASDRRYRDVGGIQSLALCRPRPVG
jgi:hypothetical protein